VIKHGHTETVSYDGGDENSSYTRTYKHKHLFDHAAHTHLNMLQDIVPIVRVGRDVLRKGDDPDVH